MHNAIHTCHFGIRTYIVGNILYTLKSSSKGVHAIKRPVMLLLLSIVGSGDEPMDIVDGVLGKQLLPSEQWSDMIIFSSVTPSKIHTPSSVCTLNFVYILSSKDSTFCQLF